MSSLLSMLAQGQPPQSTDETPAGEQKPMAILKQMIRLAQQYIGVEPDDVDKHTMTKVLQQLQSYLAKDQQDAEKMMGSSPAVNAMARQARVY